MKTSMIILLGLFLSFSVTGGFAVQATETVQRIEPLGQGMPLPWPFPWAKECSVDWNSMQGRYLLSESAGGEQIDLKITVVSFRGFSLLHMSRYDRFGETIADGFSLIMRDQRMLRVDLISKTPSEASLVALVGMYHADASGSCAEEKLVPILSLRRTGSNAASTNQYRLVRIVSGGG